MKGISEESLKKLWDSFYITEELVGDFEERMMCQCEEINDWKPIDENTPTDRRILLYWDCYINLEQTILIKKYKAGDWGIYKPTHWQELPPAPNE